jgi:hypothetical protein
MVFIAVVLTCLQFECAIHGVRSFDLVYLYVL